MKPWTYVLLIGVALVLAYEVRANFGDEYPTLTALAQQASDAHPMFVVFWGALTGHLFWRR